MRLCLFFPNCKETKSAETLLFWSRIDSISQSLNLLLNSPSTKKLNYPYTYLVQYFINNPPMNAWQPLYRWRLFPLREPSLDLEKARFQNLKLVWNGYHGFIVDTTPTTIQVITGCTCITWIERKDIFCKFCWQASNTWYARSMEIALSVISKSR